MIENKLFIVIVSLVTIFAGLIFYLISLDRKVTKLEKQLKDKQE
jgi:CcmD family protein